MATDNKMDLPLLDVVNRITIILAILQCDVIGNVPKMFGFVCVEHSFHHVWWLQWSQLSIFSCFSTKSTGHCGSLLSGGSLIGAATVIRIFNRTYFVVLSFSGCCWRPSSAHKFKESSTAPSVHLKEQLFSNDKRKINSTAHICPETKLRLYFLLWKSSFGL